MMKKLIALLLVSILVLGLFTSCGQKPDEPNRQETEQNISGDNQEDTQPGFADLPLIEDSDEDGDEPSQAEEAQEPIEYVEDDGDNSGDFDDVPEEENEHYGEGVLEDREYSTPEEVAAYIYLYGHLPNNYITKREAQDLGWDNSKGNLWDVAPGKSIGGNTFGNYEGLLPDGRYWECDVNYDGGYRGAERLIYDRDGHVWYTADHYKTFEQLY